jgi:hypothetical protein
MRTLFATIALLLATGLRGAQAQADAALAQTDAVPSPLLLTTMPPPAHARMVTALDLGYNERAFEPVAGERLEPQASVLLPLSSALAVLAQLGIANTLDGRTRMAQQGELLVTPVRRGAFALAGGLGARHEYGGSMVATARFVGARTTERSALAAGVLLEHPYAAGRDALDLITSLGASHALTSTLWLGVEAVGSDLEGFWDSAEAEGGATLFVGPTLAFSPAGSWRLVVGGGPVLRTTSSTAASAQQRSGYVLRTSVRLGW